MTRPADAAHRGPPAFTTANSARGAQPDRELADLASADVPESITFGRAVTT